MPPFTHGRYVCCVIKFTSRRMFLPLKFVLFEFHAYNWYRVHGTSCCLFIRPLSGLLIGYVLVFWCDECFDMLVYLDSLGRTTRLIILTFILQARGPKKHLKRLHAPKSWMLDKLGGVFAPRPSTGPHKMRESLPLVIFLRNRLKYALTANDVKKIVMQRLIKVDNKVRTDPNYPSGFMGKWQRIGLFVHPAYLKLLSGWGSLSTFQYDLLICTPSCLSCNQLLYNL